MIRRVILNLLRNAVEAIQSNPETNRQLTIQGSLETDQNNENWVNITIEDNGLGIKTEDLAFVFVPFFTTKQSGHGLGLALSYRIVAQHNGLLSVENSASGGAIFTLKLKVSGEV